MLDLGEPEVYGVGENEGYYYGVEKNLHRQRDNHNIYNLLWIQSIDRGYARNNVRDRKFILSRSGAPGMQRSGAGMWSGDIASQYETLTTQFTNRFQMSFSGIDYYGSDIGGFIRAALPKSEKIDDLYTQWFADSCWTDVPVRPHTFNLEKVYHTSPAKVGSLESNRQNIMTRYRLFPYYYSLAHIANRWGIPITPGMIYEFQDESTKFGRVADQVMIGPYLMAALVSGSGMTSRDVVLPVGNWINYHTHEMHHGVSKTDASVDTLLNVSIYDTQGHLQIPVYAKSGAIVPMFDHILDDQGRVDTQSSEIVVELFICTADSFDESFMLFEDDGLTTDYLENDTLSQTEIRHSFDAKTNMVTVSFNPIKRNYPEMKGVSKIRLITEAEVAEVKIEDELVHFEIGEKGYIEIDTKMMLKDPTMVIEVLLK